MMNKWRKPPEMVTVMGAKRPHNGGKALFRFKLRSLTVAGLQRVYDHAQTLGRRDIMNWCMIEAHYRLDQQELAVMVPYGYTRVITAEGDQCLTSNLNSNRMAYGPSVTSHSIRTAAGQCASASPTKLPTYTRRTSSTQSALG